MSRSERWNTKSEIRRRFHETTDPVQGAGPVLFYENGKKYSDDGESHIAVIGRTGKGKSQCCSLPFERECLSKGESLIVLDPKGEGYRKNACYIPKDYQNFCVDLRNPRQSRTKWNPLAMPYRLFKSDNPDDHDVASSMISELWNGVYPCDSHSDKFWPESAANYAKGLTYALFETQPEEYVNLNSVAVMMEQSLNGKLSPAREAVANRMANTSLYSAKLYGGKKSENKDKKSDKKEVKKESKPEVKPQSSDNNGTKE